MERKIKVLQGCQYREGKHAYGRRSRAHRRRRAGVRLLGALFTSVVYDKNGRAIEIRAQTGNATNPVQVQTTVYSKSDKPLSVIDAEGNITSFT